MRVQDARMPGCQEREREPSKFGLTRLEKRRKGRNSTTHAVLSLREKDYLMPDW